MMNNNKILTVSYGTFSCTLEGFDDSFGTMKAITEYFRDLSAGDRYFGSEPVQPDAALLAKIAEREIARHVEAVEDNDGIVLRAADANDQDMPSTPDVATPIAAAAAAALAAPAMPAPPEPTTFTPEIEEDAASSFFADTETQTETAIYAAPRPAVDPASVLPPEDSIADKLQRIRAVVSRGDAQDLPSFAEDEHADGFMDETTRDLEDALDMDDQIDDAEDEAELDEMHSLLNRLDRDGAAEDAVSSIDTDDLSEVEMPEAEMADDTPYQSSDDDAALLARLAADEVELNAEPEVIQEDVAAEMPLADARLVKVDRDALEAAISEGDIEEVEVEAEDDVTAEDTTDEAAPFKLSDMIDDEDTSDEPVVSSLSDDEEAELLRELEAVETSLEGDEAEPEMADLEETFEEASVAASEELEAEAEAEAEPEEMDALSKFVNGSSDHAKEAETAFADDEAQAEDDYEEEYEAEIAEASDLRRADDTPVEENLSRLMEKADTEMDAPENTSRRDAFSHLRAAVAATKVDKILGKSKDEDAEKATYREDLANVIPRRPESGSRRTERPNTDRPAPLKLVAEQRIDLEDARPSGPVSPRRVSAQVADPIAAGAESFADYAESMGADKLPELLEAAASYMAYVEGRDQFSRPQLMTKVRQVEQDQFSREDGLRSFGQLLRAGKIEKIKGGRFTVSEQIGFKPDEREAG